MAATTTLIESN
jgi:hypothetical protein